ncbi:MAG: hypothetical protein IJV18_05115 [Acidaminococcaceae bacterium]|nr:hypothetical protein [Acidaminococcaceae bacterium]
MDIVDEVIKAASEFYLKIKVDPNARYRSWEHCYKCFHDALANYPNVNNDYLCLHLAFYLASWGMYRGSSFLLQKDYKIHAPVVEELLKPKYDCLSGLECSALKRKDVQNKLKKLEFSIEKYYDQFRNEGKSEKVKKKLSTTLITKILMGTLGCVPAYDRYFVNGVKKLKITTGNYNIKSLLRLVDFYENNRERLEAAKKSLMVYDLPYPQMKLLDMAFWEIGLEKKKYSTDGNKKKMR